MEDFVTGDVDERSSAAIDAIELVESCNGGGDANNFRINRRLCRVGKRS